MISHVWEGVTQGVNYSPYQGVCPQCPHRFWDLLHVRTQYEKQQPNFARFSN